MSAADECVPVSALQRQQESGSVGIASRGPNGDYFSATWHPVGAEELWFTYRPAPTRIPTSFMEAKFDAFLRPADPNQGQNILPQALSVSMNSDGANGAGFIFSSRPTQACLFFATNTLWQTTAGGRKIWQENPAPDEPQDPLKSRLVCRQILRDHTTGAKPRPKRGVIYTVAGIPASMENRHLAERTMA